MRQPSSAANSLLNVEDVRIWIHGRDCAIEEVYGVVVNTLGNSQS